MKQPQKKEITEEEFLSICNVIAQNHGMTVDRIDFENFCVYFNGDPENELACALELDDVLGKYAI